MKGMRMIAALALTVGVATAQAQQNPPPMDTSRPMMDRPGPGGPGMRGQGEPERMRQMRQQVEERFGQMIQTQLELNDGDMQRLRTAMRANQDRHQGLMRREMDAQRGIRGQMTPGEPANNDSLNRFMAELSRIRIERAQSDDQFQRDLVFLPPVKRVRLMGMMRNFEQRVRDIAERRREGMDDRRPGADGRGPDGPNRPRQQMPREGRRPNQE